MSRSNTKRRTISTATGKHPRKKTRIISRRRGRGLFYYKKEEYECEYIMDKEAKYIDNLSLI